MKVANHSPEKWALFTKAIRSFFDSKGFLEVSTPSLVSVGAFENALDCLKVQFLGGQAELHTSPEIEMKVLLAELQKPIFQICKCFRDDPDTSIHFKEFTMLEFYLPGATYLETRELMKELVGTVSSRPIQFSELSIHELFLNQLGIDLPKTTTAEALKAAAERVGIDSLDSQHTWEDIFFRLMLDKIEPALDYQKPTLVYDYPASVSTLSKPKEIFWGERFEIFWKGMELCNGATELKSVELLKSRYQFESKERQKMGKTPHPFPSRLAEAMERMPDCSGVAVGLDRLFWAVS